MAVQDELKSWLLKFLPDNPRFKIRVWQINTKNRPDANGSTNYLREDGTWAAPAGGGGGGVTTIADGDDVAEGTTTDAAWSGSGAGTVISLLKKVATALAGTLTVATHAVTQSGTWTTARSWTLSSGTDSVNVGNFPATQPVSGSVSVSNFPATQPVSGTVAVSTLPTATAKGTQGSTFVPTQDAKDAGRTQVTLFLDAVTGITTEALATMQINKGGVAQTAATSYTVTAGKTFRISGLHTTVKNTSTVASDSRVRVRQASSSLSVSSPIVLLNEAGSVAALANSAGTDDTVITDGMEIAGGQQIGISHVESATTCTISVCLTGYEY